jgi:DNA-binding phage protein
MEEGTSRMITGIQTGNIRFSFSKPNGVTMNQDELLEEIRRLIGLNGGNAYVCNSAGIGPTCTHRMLRKGANPSLRTILKLLNAMGYQLQVVKKSKDDIDGQKKFAF